MYTNKKHPLIRFDWATKSMLRDKANYDILEGFLSVLLQEDITVLSILESKGKQAYESDKFNRVDLVAENQHKELIVIEVQNNRDVHYFERLLYGSSKLVVDHVQLGEGFEKVKKVIAVSIMFSPLGENGSDYVYRGETEFFGLNDHSRLEFTRRPASSLLGEAPDLRNNGNISPEYYLIDLDRFRDVVRSDLDEWIYYFKNADVKKEFKSKNIQKAREKLDLLRMTEGERRAYESYLINRMIEKDIFETARLEGEMKGRKEAMEESKEEGRKAEMREGKKAGKYAAKMAIAANLLDRGMKTAEVAEITGLSEKELSKLR